MGITEQHRSLLVEMRKTLYPWRKFTIAIDVSTTLENPRWRGPFLAIGNAGDWDGPFAQESIKPAGLRLECAPRHRGYTFGMRCSSTACGAILSEGHQMRPTVATTTMRSTLNEEAEAFAKANQGTEEPLALVLQREYIDEPETGHYVHVREERVTEWPVKFLSRPRRDEFTIPEFLAPDAPAHRLDVLRGLAPRRIRDA